MIAGNLGVCRQAILTPIGQFVDLGILQLAADPTGRCRMIAARTDLGARMRREAQQAMDELAEQLADKLGHDRFAALLETLEADWGENIARKAEPAKARGG